MIILFGALALMVGIIASLALDSWLLLVAALGLHALLSVLVIGYGLIQANKTGDKPDPVTQARIEEEGSRHEQEAMERESVG